MITNFNLRRSDACIVLLLIYIKEPLLFIDIFTSLLYNLYKFLKIALYFIENMIYFSKLIDICINR